MISENGLKLDESLLRRSRPFGKIKERPQKFWRMVDQDVVDSLSGNVSFKTLPDLLELFLGSDSIVSDNKEIFYHKISGLLLSDMLADKSVKCGDITITISSKDRSFYNIRKGNEWGSIWLWDDDYSPSELEKVINNIILGFYDAGWEVHRILPPVKMFERLLLEKTTYGDFPDILSGEINPEAAIRAWNTFRGGRMESAILGSCSNVFDYDLNTAYFSVLRTLPSLRFVDWVDSKKYVKNAFFGFCRCNVDVADSTPVGLCAVRVKAGNKPMRQYYPSDENESWRTKSEIDLLNKSGLASVEIVSGSWGIPRDNAPFAFMRVAAVMEKAIKDPRCFNMAKSMCSVCWGKLASITSPFFSPVYASYITSEVRARVTELSLLLERHLVAITVDGLSVCKRLPESMVSSEIGALKERKVDKMISLSDYYRYNEDDPPKTWSLVDDGVFIDGLSLKVPFGSSKRISPKSLSLSVLKNNQFVLAPPTSEDVIELYMTTNDFVPWDVW